MHDPAKPVRILIIDDDEDDYILTSGFLQGIEDRTLDIEWCYNYKTALEKISAHAADLYLVDYRLGAKTGIDLLQEAMQLGCEEPIILLTGKGNSKIDKQAMEMGAVDYLIKGELTTEKLERCIRYSLERASSTKALRSNEKKYRNIFEKSKEAVFTTNRELFFKDVNTAMSRLVGCEKEELLKMNLYELLNEDSVNMTIKQQLLEQGEVNDLEIELVNRNGKKRYCILNLSLERDGTHQLYVQGILHDITNQKKTERATLLAEKLAATGRLVRTLAHEVRNPLSNIHMSLEQLAGLTREEDRIYLDIIDRNGKRINDLITELLTSSKPAEMVAQKIVLQEVIDDAIAVALDRLTLKQIKLNLSYPDSPCYVKGDRSKLKIALLNIIINAVEAIDHHTGLLTISLSCNEENNVLEIADNGCGIPQENLSRLFEPFFTSKRNGIGLGLASTLNILQAHNATVEVKSRVSEGTTFLLIFNHVEEREEQKEITQKR